MTPDHIKQFRAEQNLTQQALADMLGVSQVTVARWETGVSTPPGRLLEMALDGIAAKDISHRSRVTNSRPQCRQSRLRRRPPSTS